MPKESRRVPTVLGRVHRRIILRPRGSDFYFKAGFRTSQELEPTLDRQKHAVDLMHAVGNFDVKITPVAPDDKSGDPAIGRMLIDKQFHGALEATSKGEMLASMSGVKGSAGYVAMERVQGMLDGRNGAFVLQHTGTMKRGEPGLSVTVVPDSGTEELTGLTGSMKIDIVDGKHFYEFDYALEEKH